MDLTKLTNSEILGLTIIGEARGEPIEGQVAVGSVIRNRLNSNTIKYRSYHDVCLERKQFSCWNEDDPNRIYLERQAELITIGNHVLSDMYLKQCLYIAIGIKDLHIIDNTGGALNYMTSILFNSDKRPLWARKVKNVRIFGKQTFFNIDTSIDV